MRPDLGRACARLVVGSVATVLSKTSKRTVLEASSCAITSGSVFKRSPR